MEYLAQSSAASREWERCEHGPGRAMARGDGLTIRVVTGRNRGTPQTRIRSEAIFNEDVSTRGRELTTDRKGSGNTTVRYDEGVSGQLPAASHNLARGERPSEVGRDRASLRRGQRNRGRVTTIPRKVIAVQEHSWGRVVQGAVHRETRAGTPRKQG